MGARVVRPDVAGGLGRRRARVCPGAAAVCLAAFASAGCPGGGGGFASDAGQDGVVVASATVGTEGGRLEGSGIVLEIPPGAVDAPMDFSIAISDTVIPGAELLSPIYRLEPAGAEFTQPLTLTLDIPEGETGAIFFSSPEGTGYDILNIAEGGQGVAEITHFSEAGAGACELVLACPCVLSEERGGGNACMFNPCIDNEKQCNHQTCTGRTDIFPEDRTSGFYFQREYECACFCVSDVTYTYSNQLYRDALLCRRPLQLRNGSWVCSSALDGGVPEVTSDPNDPRAEWTYQAWPAPEPVPLDEQNPVAYCRDQVRGGCGQTGYWIDYQTATHPGVNREASGRLVDCSPVEVNRQWQEEECTIDQESCAYWLFRDWMAEVKRSYNVAAVANGQPAPGGLEIVPPDAVDLNYGQCVGEPEDGIPEAPPPTE